MTHDQHPAVRALSSPAGRRFAANRDGYDGYRTVTFQVDPDPDAVEVRELRGTSYLVAPVVAVAEGVLNGGFLPFEEIAESAPGWNGVPVTINHPEDEDGEFVPASKPEALERHESGRFLDVEADPEDKSLTGNLWINLGDVKWLTEHADEIGTLAERAVQKLREGEKLEVSTGYWHRVRQESGEYQGVEYDAVQTDLLPDHLAVLPNSEGACNWEGDTTATGCGTPRANDADAESAGHQTELEDVDESVRATVVNTVTRALGLDVDDSVDADDTNPTGVSYAAHAANCDCGGCAGCSSMGDNTSDRIERLASQTEFSVEELEALDDDTVDTIEASLDANDAGGDDPDDDVDASTNTNDGQTNDGGDPPEWASSLQQQVESLEERLEAKQEDEREELVEQITTFSSFEADELPEDVDKLRSMAEKIGAPTESTYAGRAAGASNGDDSELDQYGVGGAFASQEEADIFGGDD